MSISRWRAIEIERSAELDRQKQARGRMHGPTSWFSDALPFRELLEIVFGVAAVCVGVPLLLLLPTALLFWVVAFIWSLFGMP